MNIHVVLVSYGEPPQARLIDQYLYSYRILTKLTARVAPIPKFLFPIIGAYRAFGRKRTWLEQDYSSPLEEITQAQVSALKAALKDRGIDANVHAAYEFRNPRMETVLQNLVASPGNRVFVIPMYAFDSDFTSGFIPEFLAEITPDNNASHAEVLSCDALATQSVHVLVKHLLEHLEQQGWKEENCLEAGLILSSHGTIVQPPPGIKNTGLHAVIRLYCLFLRELHDKFKAVTIAWLNHERGGKWTQPDMERTLARMERKGIKKVAYFPFGFFADNAETELEGRMFYTEHPGLEVVHVPCINSDPRFLAVLAEAVASQC